MNSSWIDDVKYKSLPDGNSYVVIFLKEATKHCPSCGGRGYVPLDTLKQSRPCRDCYGTGYVRIPEALLYGPKLPSWLPGLIQAGTGGRSIGHAYHKLLKGKFPCQTVKGEKEVRELREMMS